MSYQLNTRWDLEVYNREAQLVLVVQIKSKLNASVAWAVQFRRNILAHGIFPTAPYFIFIILEVGTVIGHWSLVIGLISFPVA